MSFAAAAPMLLASAPAATATATAATAATGAGLFSASNLFLASSLFSGVGSILSGIQGAQQANMQSAAMEQQVQLQELEARRRQVQRTEQTAEAMASINARASAQGINPGVGAPAVVADAVSRRAEDEAAFDRYYTQVQTAMGRRNAQAYKLSAGGRLASGFINAGVGALNAGLQYRQLR